MPFRRRLGQAPVIGEVAARDRLQRPGDHRQIDRDRGQAEHGAARSRRTAMFMLAAMLMLRMKGLAASGLLIRLHLMVETSGRHRGHVMKVCVMNLRDR